MKPYLDTCVVIYLREGPAEQKARLHERIGAVDSQLAVSDLVRLECLVGPLRSQNHELVADYTRFFTQPGLQVTPLTAAVCDQAADLRARYGLKTPDALHAAAAIAAGCGEFWTNDSRLSVLGPQIRVVVVS